MRWWLGEYLDENQIVQSAFLAAYADISSADLKYIKKSLDFDTEKLSAAILVKEIDKNPQKRRFDNIANALTRAAVTTDSKPQYMHDEIQRFHQSWQERMRADWSKQAQYHQQIVERLRLLNEDGLPLHQLTAASTETDSIVAYASCLAELLLSPNVNGPELINQLEQLLGLAEQKHVERIAEIATLIAFHFVPKPFSEKRQSNGVTIGSDNPAPAIYRLLQSCSNNFVSQHFEYDGRDGGVKGAIPLPRTALVSDDFVGNIAERLDNRVDGHHLANAGADGYEIKGVSYSPRQFKSIDRQLALESKAADSRFVYAMEPGVLDEKSVESLEEHFPSLNHYSHQLEEDDAIPEVVDLDSFLKTAGKKIDERLLSFETDKPLDELTRLVATALQESGHGAKVAEAPKAVDRVKYLKWINEVVKADKSIREALGRYPGFAEKASEVLSSVKQLSTSSLRDISTLIENVGKGIFS